MENKLVSVLICTYNAERTIRWTLNSILAQTYKEYEVLVLDNDSKDNTLEILNGYSRRNKSIKVFSEWKNLWAYWWLNYLLNKAKWEYIAIQDHDDIWHPEKLDKQVKFLVSNKNYVWCWTTTLMYYGISKMWYLVDIKEQVTNCVIHTSLLFRNNWKRYDESNIYLCDVDFMKRVLCNYENKLFVIWEPLTLHYIKENWWNYSDIWFSLNKKNIKKYMDLIWNDLYHIFCLLFTLFCQIIPLSYRNKFELWVLKIVHRFCDFDDLVQDRNVKILLSFL